MAVRTTPRKSAEERREEILAVAMKHFAEGGYHGTSTENIAREAGISQPYLFRLFRTKKELFLGCNERACDKVIDAFRRAANGMLLNVLTALDLEAIAGEDEWAAAWSKPEDMMSED